eukprot:TRINITY_DN560_c1_g1_i2.p1 TRINITY_DN560_c1_g1~~TRINITY_DN560_c1_g1_i2.p1  ORF type:complete len:334 (+),score=76.87 TRINITY_DN560_c1_g1_i2:87-1088(+)
MLRNWTLAIHGGAGVISKQIASEIRDEYLQGLRDALQCGTVILQNQGTSLDAVEAVVRCLEDNPLFNAGKGAVFTSQGTHELDASIMDGRQLACGAVAAVSNVRNPVSVARRVMERTPHILLVGPGAEAFAVEQGFEPVPLEYYHTKRRYEQLQQARKDAAIVLDHTGLSKVEARKVSPSAASESDKESKSASEPYENIKSTVGAVALDVHGNLAAATSTGGMTNKRPGRVGDTSIIGAGTYASNRSAAVSGTGTGEQFMRHTVARDVCALMEYRGLPLLDACNEVVFNKLEKGDGGCIAVDAAGNAALVFNCPGMFRGLASSKGDFDVRIWE